MNEFQNNNIQTLPDYGQPVNTGTSGFKFLWVVIANIVLIVVNLVMAVISLSRYDSPYYCMIFVCMLMCVYPLMKYGHKKLIPETLALILNLAVLALFIFIFCKIKIF